MFWTPLCQTCRHYAVLLSKCYDSATASCSPIQLLIGAIQLYNLSDTIPWEKPKSMDLCLKVESLKKKNNSNILDTSWHICFLSVNYLFLHVVHVSHIYIYISMSWDSLLAVSTLWCAGWPALSRKLVCLASPAEEKWWPRLAKTTWTWHCRGFPITGGFRICMKSVSIKPYIPPSFASFQRVYPTIFGGSIGHHPTRGYCSPVLENSHRPMHQAPCVIGGFGVPETFRIEGWSARKYIRWRWMIAQCSVDG